MANPKNVQLVVDSIISIKRAFREDRKADRKALIDDVIRVLSTPPTLPSSLSEEERTSFLQAHRENQIATIRRIISDFGDAFALRIRDSTLTDKFVMTDNEVRIGIPALPQIGGSFDLGFSREMSDRNRSFTEIEALFVTPSLEEGNSFGQRILEIVGGENAIAILQELKELQ
ncbi:MAG: hypothetical protein QW838_02830 [Candidatus Nitrosotenuis sp.]